jgi:hypothetical protein
MKLTSAFLFVVLSIPVIAQKIDLEKSFISGKLRVVNRNATVSEKNTLRLDENSGEGLAWITDASFTKGSIEVSLKGKDAFQKSFIGIALGGSNDSTYEAVYFRPFNFHSKDSVRKIHAVQYVSHPTYTWKKLREEQNGIFEKGIDNAPDPNAWFKATIEVDDETVKVYVNESKKPSLVVRRILVAKGTKVGLWTGDGSDGEFRSLNINNKN